MATDDFFRSRLDQMIDLRHPLAVLTQRMPWSQIEAALAPMLAHKDRTGAVVGDVDLFGPSAQLVGAGGSAAGRPRLSIRLMASLLHLKHAFNLSDEELVERWAENVIWQYFVGPAKFRPPPQRSATTANRAVPVQSRALIASSTTTKARREAITSRPWLMTSVGRRSEHAGQTTITLTSMHGEFKTAREALVRVSRLLQQWGQEAAEQLHGKSVWHRCCEHLKQVLAAIGPPKKMPAITFASG